MAADTARRADRESVAGGDWRSLLDYELPGELIAQRPAARRQDARLMVVRRASGTIEHRRFFELPRLLRAGDCVVANDSRVVPARLSATKPSGGAVELLILGPSEKDRGQAAIYRSAKRLREGTLLEVGGKFSARVRRVEAGGRCVVEFEAAQVADVLAQAGNIPLPPYIKRPHGADAADGRRYQTVFARDEGSVAAPTAGLHFSPSVLARLAEQSISFDTVTLHVGPGTFAPIRRDPDSHELEAERCSILARTAERINGVRRRGGRCVAVGTTTVRTLEWAADDKGVVRAAGGATDLYIRPGFEFRVADALLTNFHLPRTTLLCLVMAFAGASLVQRAYREAVERRYRFYSYGDAMLVL